MFFFFFIFFTSCDASLKVGSSIVEPFLMMKHECLLPTRPDLVNCAGSHKYEGYCMDLLKKLGEKIAGFEFEIFLYNRIGEKNINGTFDGIIGDVSKEKLDLGLGMITVTKERKNTVDFSTPFMITGISMMARIPELKPADPFFLLSPFSKDVWILIIIAYIGLILTYCFVASVTCKEQSGSCTLSRSTSSKFVVVIIVFFTLIVFSCFTANLASYLTESKINFGNRNSIKFVDDLVKQNDIQYGIQAGGSTSFFFQTSTLEIYRRLWHNMNTQDPPVFVKNYKEGIERVQESGGKYIFLLEETANEYQNSRRPCDTMKIGGRLNKIDYAIALPINSTWKDKIDLALEELKIAGELERLKDKWWYDRGQCDIPKSQTHEFGPLYPSEVNALFYLFIIVVLVALLVALIEFLVKRGKNEVLAHQEPMESGNAPECTEKLIN